MQEKTAIRLSFSSRDSYEQNGVAERSHRTVIETTCTLAVTLLISACLPVLLVLGLRHAVYLTGYLVGSRQ